MTNSEHPGLSRRTVLTGAAWSVPVIALAAAAPAAAASGDTITVKFAATLIQLHYSDTFAALVEITNTSGVDLAPETLLVTLTDLPTNGEVTVEFPNTPTMSDDENDALTVSNPGFTATDPSTGSITIISAGPIALAAHQTLVFGLYFRRPALNVTEDVYIIAGSFTFGAFGGGVGGTRVELIADGEPG